MSETVAGSNLVGKVVGLDIKAVSERWGWFMALGVLLILLGMTALGAPFASGIGVSLLVGWLLVISGVAHGIHAFKATLNLPNRFITWNAISFGNLTRHRKVTQ